MGSDGNSVIVATYVLIGFFAAQTTVQSDCRGLGKHCCCAACSGCSDQIKRRRLENPEVVSLGSELNLAGIGLDR